MSCRVFLLLVAACCAAPVAGAAAAPRATLTAYASEAQMAEALAGWRGAAQQLTEWRRRDASPPVLMEQAVPSPVAPAAKAVAPSVAGVAADRATSATESITNVQTQGVDEGDIVKLAGQHLVILRRGRLFTVRLGSGELRPVAAIDAYAPHSDPRGAWYDELLVSGSTVAVIGYHAAHGGTEIGLFELGADGSLTHRDTYHLRSDDYYATRNYASRLIGHELILYTPMQLSPWGPAPFDAMPALRRWQGDDALPFRRILPATRVYRTDDEFDPRRPLALHTVTRCDLARSPMRCESQAVLGPVGRVFYVGAQAVYLWTAATSSAWGGSDRSALFRIPLSGGAPTALKTAGVPIDQMSFLEDGEGYLNVLLRAQGPGESMGGSERTRGGLALLRLPVEALGDGHESAQPSHYRRLPAAEGASLVNRFVGDWLLWAAGEQAWALRVAGDEAAVPLRPAHAVERIEALGRHALLVGNAGRALHFTRVALGTDAARLAGAHVLDDARQGETRSHGFFYAPTGSDEGLLGLPVQDAGSAAVVYLRQRGASFSALGELRASSRGARDDACVASCVDWYGNARPLFIGGRVFALMGYELVEAERVHGRWDERLVERWRVDFSPRRAGRYSPFD
jgi:hypothetical protein